MIYFVKPFGLVDLRSKTKNVYILTINMNNPLRKDYNLLLNYFQRFPLKTTKNYNFKIWCDILKIIVEKKHKTLVGFEKIKKLRNELNK